VKAFVHCRRRWAVVVAMVGTLAVGATVVQAGTIYVFTAGNDANDGLSWATAKQKVQTGLNAATAGDQVWVAAGTYVENITLKADVALYGGFAGGETERQQRDWRTNRTILDGNRAGSVVTVPAGATPSARIDGFTIANGKTSFTLPNYMGGGIVAVGASPTIANNVIRDNIANDGGGIYLKNSAAVIVNNTISGNSAIAGGGLCVWYDSPLIANNVITGNGAIKGSAMSTWYGSPTITGNTIAANVAGRNTGGALNLTVTSGTIANNIIAFNSAGIYMNWGDTVPVLRGNCAYGNMRFNYWGLADPTGTNNNISTDPMFADLACGNFHLQPGSPSIDAGSSGDALSGWLDIDGQSRQAGAAVDIGADEADGTTWPVGPYTVVQVRPDGDDSADGTSWGNAKRTVQAGIDAAALLGGEVWVAAGTYAGCVTLRNHVYLYGGFAGSETSRDQRNSRVHVTVLDGQRQGWVLTSYGGHRIGAVDGFTITNGGGYTGEGGVDLEYSSCTVANNIVVGNAGTGIRARMSWATIAGNTIARNVDGTQGGGLYAGFGDPTIVNNTIVGNAGRGGGIYLDNSYAVMTGNTIVANTGGAVHHADNCNTTTANSIIAFNAGGFSSGGTNTVFVRYSCIYGNGTPDYTGGVANIRVDPMLASIAYGNVHLQPGSPCINAGNNGDVPAGWSDIDGQPRQTGLKVDMGADESEGTTWPAGPYTIVRVKADGDDTRDGSSWQRAKRTVQAAVNAAAAVGGDVWVAAGTYGGAVMLHPFVHLYGGFGGTEMDASSRNWVTNASVLDGGGVFSVLTADGIAPLTGTIDGFRIRNGKAGIYCDEASPRIANNTISAATGGTSVGAISCVYRSCATITNNTIKDNLGYGLYSNDSSCTITGNTIMRNGGSGIFCVAGGVPAITGNTIRLNSAIGDGGGIRCEAASATIVGNVIDRNTATDSGGGVYCSATVAMRNNTITGNRAGEDGGGVYLAANGSIANNAISGNAAYRGGGMYLSYVTSTTAVANTTIVGNTAVDGAGMYLGSSYCRIACCTITGNTASNHGAGLYIRSSYYGPPALVNTLVAFNTSGVYKADTYTGPTMRNNCVYGNTAYNFSGLADLTGTSGNISADPQLVRPASDGGDGWGDDPATPDMDEGANDDYGDLRLLPGSPCIDAGNNPDVPADGADVDGDGDVSEPLPMDLAGAARFADDPYMPDTGGGTAPIVDMGAYEHRLADANGDGYVDVVDLLGVVYAFGTIAGDPTYDATCDFNADGAVDVADLLDIVHNFGT
jgi:parallel beta-helix repeat protein